MRRARCDVLCQQRAATLPLCDGVAAVVVVCRDAQKGTTARCLSAGLTVTQQVPRVQSTTGSRAASVTRPPERACSRELFTSKG